MTPPSLNGLEKEREKWEEGSRKQENNGTIKIQY